MDYDIRSAKDWARETLTGYFAVTTTPFDSDHEIDEAGLQRNVEWLISQPSTRGIYAHSVFQETTTLSMAERKLVAGIVVAAVSGRVPVVIETSAESYGEVIELSNHARDASADLVMLAPPTAGLQTAGGVIDFYKRVAAETEIGICVFSSTWADVGFHVSVDLLLELAELDAVCMVKDAAGSVFDFYEKLEKLGRKLVVSRPNEAYWLAGRLLFGKELCPPVFMGTTRTIYCDRLITEFYEAALAEDWPVARSTMMESNGLSAQIFTNHKRGFHEVAKTKAISGLYGMATGPVRPPIAYPASEELAQARQILADAGMLDGVATTRTVVG